MSMGEPLFAELDHPASDIGTNLLFRISLRFAIVAKLLELDYFHFASTWKYKSYCIFTLNVAKSTLFQSLTSGSAESLEKELVGIILFLVVVR
jgi:hypothetical protein